MSNKLSRQVSRLTPPPVCKSAAGGEKLTSPWIPPAAAERGRALRRDRGKPETAATSADEPPEPYAPAHIEATGSLLTPAWPPPKFSMLKLEEIYTVPPARYDWEYYKAIPGGYLIIDITLTTSPFPKEYHLAVSISRTDIAFHDSWLWTNQTPRQEYPFFTQTHTRHLDPPSTQARLCLEFTDINAPNRCLGSPPKW